MNLIYNLWYFFERMNSVPFFKNMEKFKKIQERGLLNYIRKNKDTLFGKEHNFKGIKNIKDFKKYVPVREYKDFLKYIEKIKKGEHNILTSEKVLFLHPTGGTTGTKLIPYTKSLKREFLKGLSPWFYDVFKNFADIKKGKTYWVVTPAGKKIEKFKDLKIKVGFSEDNEYFGLKGKLLSFIHSVPFCVSKIEDIELFKYITSLFLVKEKNLTWISLWSPTFLEIIIDGIEKNIEIIKKSIYDGRIYIPFEKKGKTLDKIRFKKDRKRADEIDEIFKFDREERYKDLWKNLKFISMWMSAESYYPAQRIKKLFPDTFFQPKGLLMTEGIVTIPLFDVKSFIPAYYSHYFEFVLEKSKDILNLWELEEGEKYSVVITTGGGLYRYDTEDLVEVKGFYKGMPLLEFIGRKGNFSDLVGEKLSEDFAKECIEKALREVKISFKFLMIAPEEVDKKYLYILFIETGEDIQKIIKFSQRLEEYLETNFYYKNAIELGQLEKLKVFKVKDGIKTYTEECIERGQRMGEIKPLIFRKDRGWIKVFEGEFL